MHWIADAYDYFECGEFDLESCHWIVAHSEQPLKRYVNFNLIEAVTSGCPIESEDEMIKPNPPSELNGYQFDPKAASQAALLPRLFGWLTVVSFLVMVGVFIFQPEKKPIVMGLFVGFIILFGVYIFIKIFKRKLQCNRCNQPMQVIDVKWSPEEWKRVQKYELLDNFKGADGKLYTIEKEKRSGSTHYFIHAHMQRWYACHHCRLYFLDAPYFQEMLFSSIYEEEFKEARQAVLSDPHASEKMKQAYMDRLQGRS